MYNTEDRTRTGSEEVTKLKNLVINSINEFRNTNEPYGYSTIQVNQFFDKLIDKVRFIGVNGDSNFDYTQPYSTAGKAELFKAEYMKKGNWLTDIINNVKFTQGFRGYDTFEVDNYLDELIRTVKYHSSYENISIMIDINAIKNIKFNGGFRGYDCKEVDIFLDDICMEFEKFNSIKKKHS